MGKFHINDSGEPKRCIAGPGRCKYRQADGSEVEHYATKEEARDAYERAQEDEALPTPSAPEPERPRKSGVVDYADIGLQHHIAPTLKVISEHLGESTLAELRESPVNSNGWLYAKLADEYSRGEYTDGQFVNLALNRSESAVAVASYTVQAIIERDIYERHLGMMREEYREATADLHLESSKYEPDELNRIFENSFNRASGIDRMSPEERAEELQRAKRTLEIFAPLHGEARRRY